jgi:hypothetical protein
MIGVRVLAVITLLLLGACDQRAMMDKMASKEDLVFAKHFVEVLQQQDFVAAHQMFEPEGLQASSQEPISSLARLIPVEPPVSIRPQGVQVMRRPDFRQTDLVFEYEFPGKQWLLVELVLVRKSGNAPLIHAANITPLPASFREINAFSLVGKSLAAYLVAGAALVVILFIGISLIVCLFRTNLRWWWKIAWCLAMFAGVGHLLVNWTTGAISFDPLSLNLASFSIGRLGPDGPYYFETVFPVGAIAYWLWRRRSRPLKLAEQAARFD